MQCYPEALLYYLGLLNLSMLKLRDFNEVMENKCRHKWWNKMKKGWPRKEMAWEEWNVITPEGQLWRSSQFRLRCCQMEILNPGRLSLYDIPKFSQTNIQTQAGRQLHLG